MKRILAIWLPNWSVQRLVSIRPELRGQAVILDQPSRRGREVATCSPTASKLGVCPGMPIAEATALVRKARDSRKSNAALSLYVEPHDLQTDRCALEKLAAWCHQYSPHVGVEDCESPETLFLDATGVAPLFGGERAFVEQVARGFGRLRFTCIEPDVGVGRSKADPLPEQRKPGHSLKTPCIDSLALHKAEVPAASGFARSGLRMRSQGGLIAQLALADTVGAAWAVSHYGCQNPLAAEANIVESGKAWAATGDGLPIRPPVEASKSDSGCNAIGQLPLAALRLPPAMAETLGRLGLQQIGQLQSIPRVELQARFGTLLLRRLDQVFGAADEVVRCVQPPSDFTAQWLLEHPTDQRDAIQTVIQRLVEQLARRLADCGQGALQLVCRLDADSDANPTRKQGAGVAGDERSEPPVNNGAGGSLRSTPATQSATSFEIGLFRPSAQPRHLLELVNMQMEQFQLPGSVNCVSVQVPRHARLEQRQPGLFDQDERKSESRQVSVLVDRLAGRLGRGAVVRCMLQSDAQPELAYRQQPLVDQSPRQRKNHSTRSFLSPLDRPLHLLKEPLEIQVMAVAPTGPPIRFRYRGQDCQVARHWGPERIETGWWRRRGVQRDYYRVETKTGQRFWLFRQLQTGKWFLHGEFG